MFPNNCRHFFMKRLFLKNKKKAKIISRRDSPFR